MRIARAVVAAAASLTILGCSVLTDLKGFSNGTVVGEEGGPGIDAAASDASFDASTDGGATDASTLVDAEAGTSTCSGTHFFCTDFDTRVLADEWDVVAPGQGTLDRSTSASVSAPFALVVTHPIGNPDSAPVLVKTVATGNTGIGGLRCSFDYRRDAVDAEGVVVALAIDFNTNGTDHLFVEIKDGKVNGRIYLAAVQPGGNTLDDFPTVPTFSTTIGEWTKVAWTIDLRSLKSELKSGATVIDTRVVPFFDPSHTVSAKIAFGLANYLAPTSPWKVRYDNFVCDALP